MIVDGISVDRVVRPASVTELSSLMSDSKAAVVPMGSGTQMHFGNPLRAADCIVDLTGLSRITTYNPAELTIHVEAGVTLGEIQSALAANRQALPLDPWNGPSATIGGIAAANAQGPLRATGSIRDWIIGMKVVHVDGRVSKTGGRVVKNVTGYDLGKLYTGSLGSLAVIAEISFKLRAQFPKTSTAIAEFEKFSKATTILQEIRKSPLQPIACELEGSLKPDRHAVLVRFGEHPQAVAWQIGKLPGAGWKVLEEDQEMKAWEELRLRYSNLGPIVVRVIGLPTEIGAMIEEFRPAAWIAHASSGIVLMAIEDVQSISAIRERYPAVIEKAPLELRRQVATFGVRGTEKRLMQEMKQTFDPKGRLNPGRHIDGE